MAAEEAMKALHEEATSLTENQVGCFPAQNIQVIVSKATVWIRIVRGSLRVS
jgi:hypothetical protein